MKNNPNRYQSVFCKSCEIVVEWHCLNTKPKDPEKKSIVFNVQFDLITLAWKDAFIKLLPNMYVIKTLHKSNKIDGWVVWNLPSIKYQFSSSAKRNLYIILFLRSMNYPNQFSVHKNSSTNVKKSILKHENASF